MKLQVAPGRSELSAFGNIISHRLQRFGKIRKLGARPFHRSANESRFRLQILLSGADFLVAHRHCAGQGKNFYTPFFLAPDAIEISLQNRSPALERYQRRLLVVELSSKTPWENVCLLCTRRNNLLVPGGGGGKPIEILHIFGKVLSEFCLWHAADPADEPRAGDRLDARSPVNSF